MCVCIYVVCMCEKECLCVGGGQEAKGGRERTEG